MGGEATAAVISTGDELVPLGEHLRPGQIYDSNAFFLRAMLVNCGATVQMVEHCPDDEGRLVDVFKRGAQNSVMVVSGGVSVGEHDLVKSALSRIGATLDIWRVAIKPGKPFLYGRVAGCRVFGLPGNPVSSFVTFLKFVRPAVLKMMGAADEELGLPVLPARLAESVEGDRHRPHYIRGKLANGEFRPVGRQESHAVFGLSRANALLRVPPETQFDAGDVVEVEVWE